MMIKTINREDLCKVGKFGKPHGTKGEIGIVTTCDLFEDADDPYLVCEIDGIFVPFFIEDFRYKSGNVLLVKMENIDSEEAVKSFINREVYYPAAALDEAAGEPDYTWGDFIGYAVTDHAHGPLGQITDTDESTINVLLQIDHNGKELLIPAAEEFILSVDHDKKEMEVSIPEGLLHL